MTQITVFSSNAKPLTKIFKVVDGAIEKTAQANFYSGTAETRAAATPADLLALLEGLTPLQAVSTGLFRHGTKARITTAKAVKEGGDAVARSGKYCHFPKGPGWLLWDYDTAKMPEDVNTRVEELGGPLAALLHIWPDAVASAYLIRPSASGGVSAPGCPETQSSGLHGYFLIDDVSRSKEALGALMARAWAAGLAWCWVNSAGRVLSRSIVDAVVGTPERLIFEASPILIHPVTRTPKRPILSDRVDPVPVPTIDAATAAAAKAAETKAKRALKPEAARVEAEHIEERAQTHAKKTGSPLSEARIILRKLVRGSVLSDDHLLELGDGSWLRVGDALDDPAQYDRLGLPCPIEGPSYGLNNATLLLLPDPSRPNEPPVLVSHAHGWNAVFRFERYANLLPNAQTTPRRPADPPQLPPAPDARLQIDGAVGAFFGGVEGHHARSGIAALIAPEGTLDVIAAGVGLGKTTATIGASAVRLRSGLAAYKVAMEDYTSQVATQKRVKKDDREEIAVPKAPAVMVLVPEHKLSEQTARNYRRSAPDLTVAVLRGVDANDPDAPGEKVCKRLDEYREAAALLLDPTTTVCDGCPFAGSCKALASKSTKANVYIAAHGAMAGRPAALVKWREQYLAGC